MAIIYIFRLISYNICMEDRLEERMFWRLGGWSEAVGVVHIKKKIELLVVGMEKKGTNE
jgi:hypothetical protein